MKFKDSKNGKYKLIPKNITLKKLIFGDFDGDGVKNIDDTRPFSNKKSKYPDPYKSKIYYQKSRYGNNETLLSKTLKSIHTKNNKNAKTMTTFIKNNPGAFGRTKTVPSTIKKLDSKYYNDLSDVHGTTIVVTSRAQVYNKIKQLKKKYTVIQDKNYYKNPQDGVYYAYHLIIQKNNAKIEVQVKTRMMMKMVHMKMHTAYKNKDQKKLSQFKKLAKELYNKGY